MQDCLTQLLWSLRWLSVLLFYAILVPPAPTNIKLKRTSTTTLRVTWKPPSFPIRGYRVFYNTFSSPRMEEWQHKDIGPVLATVLDNLDPATVYVVRLRARSVDGRYGPYSKIIENSNIPPGNEMKRKKKKEQTRDETNKQVKIWIYYLKVKCNIFASVLSKKKESL